MFEAVKKLFGRRYMRITLQLPIQTWEAVQKLKLSPGDPDVQVFKDALQTHNQVIGEMRRGGTIYVHRGATAYPLRVDHLNTAQKRRASWNIIKGDKED